ncbi:MAG TPA: hypothetical protein VGL72_00960 [Bryobacteraceae bacterium]|jgi:hypothetical protein
MVRFTITALVTAILISATAVAEVDFTPRESFYLAEATRVPNVSFRNESVDVTYSPPGSWILSGGGRKLTLTPPNKVQAEASMRTEPMKDPMPATDENIKAYGERAVALIPREASKVVLVEVGPAPLKVCLQPLIQATLTYVLFGQQFTTTIYFLPYKKEQITFQFTARNADFQALAKDFRASLFSLQGL